MLDPSVPARVSARVEPETRDAESALSPGPAGSDAIAQWLTLEHIARIEPSLPVWRPRGKRERALWARTDAKWRALLAEARTVGDAGTPPLPPPPPSPPEHASGKTNQPPSGGFFHAPMRGRE